MNKRLDLSKLGGYPFTQKDLLWMQESYRGAFAALSYLIGDKVIVSGMQEAGGNVSDGWISIGGEMIPFLGGAKGTGEFILQETATELIFNDGESKAVRIERVARFSAGGPHLYADLKRVPAIKDTMPAGVIVMWSGAIANIPTGWALCDGSPGTPNLSGRFIVGYNAADEDYNVISKMGGSKAVTLVQNQLPAVMNFGFSVYNEGGNGYIASGGGANEGFFTRPFTNAGGGQPFNNRPPYYTLAYIIKL